MHESSDTSSLLADALWYIENKGFRPSSSKEGFLELSESFAQHIETMFKHVRSLT